MTDTTNTAVEVPAAEVPAQPAASAGGREGGIGLMAWFAIICWPLLVATATYIHLNKKMVEMTPDVLVVDDIALIKLAIDNGADRYNPDAIRDEVDRIVRSSGMDNSILLSRSMILYAPTRNQVSVSARAEPAEPTRTMK